MNTSTALFILWMLFTLVMMSVSFISMFSLQSVVDRLRVIDATNWNEKDYQPLQQVVSQNLTWILLVALCITAIVSLAFETVRAWFSDNILVASLVYIVPILILVLVQVARKIKESREAEASAGEDESSVEESTT
jgi:hypothetical protein